MMKTEIGAYSVRQFCQSHGISKSYFFQLQHMGIGPRTMKVGGRRLISREAAEQWRRDRERASESA